jgi:Fur family ferric uptake transcriptional regulator
MTQSPKTSADEIRDAGLKITPARLQVLEILKKDHCLLTIDEIAKKMGNSSKKPRADWTTIYRTLLTFKEAGLVSSTPLIDGSLRYEYSEQDPSSHHHHHHVSCKDCGKVKPIDACEVTKIEKQIFKMGFRDISHRLEFTGICEDCQ